MLWRQLQEKVWKTWQEYPQAGSDPELMVEIQSGRTIRHIPIKELVVHAGDSFDRPIIAFRITEEELNGDH